MKLQFETLMTNGNSAIFVACDNETGGCDSTGCDVCQSGCETGGDGGCDGS